MQIVHHLTWIASRRTSHDEKLARQGAALQLPGQALGLELGHHQGQDGHVGPVLGHQACRAPRPRIADDQAGLQGTSKASGPCGSQCVVPSIGWHSLRAWQAQDEACSTAVARRQDISQGVARKADHFQESTLECPESMPCYLWKSGKKGLTFILAAARTAVEAIDSTLDMEVSVLRLSDMAACSPREAAVLIARGRVPKEDTCAKHACSLACAHCD